MAQVIPSEASGLLKSLYGEIQAPIASMILDYSEQFERESIAAKLFKKVKSTHSLEGYNGVTGVDSFEPVGENGAYPTGGFSEDFDKTVRNVTWKGSMSISRELMDDSNFKDITNKPYLLTKDYARKVEMFFAQLIGEAVRGNASFVRGSETFSTLCKDGKCVFAKDHPAKIKGGNQSNQYAGEFSVENLFKAMTAMQNFKDADGNTLDLGATTLLIPNVATLKKEVYEAVGSTFDPDSANNAVNVVGGQLEIIPWSYLNDFITPTGAPWILLDKNFNEMYDGNIWQERVDVEYRDEIGANDEYRWKGYARFAGAFVDWRQMLVGGVTGGTAF